MIDIEYDVYTELATALRAAHPGIAISGVLENKPSSFPCVFIEEADNQIYTPTIDSGSNENHVQVMYEINAYSNKGKGRKAECKSIMATADDTLRGLGFVRLMIRPLSFEGNEPYRMVSRYMAVVATDKTIYQRR